MAVTSITTELLRSCIKLDLGSKEKLVERKHSMPLRNIECLEFSFKDIKAINWLFGLDSLTKLYLDNNKISKIENLSHLKTLTLLDLSFNNIQEIDGLEGLTRLDDLSLYSNQIEKLRGLETLQNLRVLSVGKNKIKRLEDTIYLRCLRGLLVLTLDGNPISKDPEYRTYVLGHMRDLKYFDHKFAGDPSVVNAARDQYQDELLEIKQREREEDLKYLSAADKKAEELLFEEANLTGVDTLYEKMIEEDPEYKRLDEVPGLLHAFDEYKDKYLQATEELKKIILEQLQKKREEIRVWKSTSEKLLNVRDTQARSSVEVLKKMKKEIFEEVQKNPESTPESATEKLAPLKEENIKLREQLIEHEMLTFGEIHDIWSAFDTNYTIIVDANKQYFQHYFGTIRMLENNCSETVMAQASILMEQFSLNELDVESEEGRALLRDKDSIVNAIQASHDARTLKIDSLEDKKLQGEVEIQKHINDEWRQGEIRRSRERIGEIDFIYQLILDDIADLVISIEK